MVPAHGHYQPAFEARFPVSSTAAAQQTEFPVTPYWQETTRIRTQFDHQYQYEDHDQEKSDMRKTLVKFHSQASNQGQQLAKASRLLQTSASFGSDVFHTSHMVTTEHINCCGNAVTALLFGSLKKIPSNEPVAILKVFLSSKTSLDDDKDEIEVSKT